MDIKNLIEMLKEVDKLDNNEKTNSSASSEADDSIWVVGKKYFIRTVTMHVSGRLLKVTDKELLLEGAAWIADSGRFHDALVSGSFSEVEPFVNPIGVGRGAIVDFTEWTHNLPNKQK